MFILPLTGGDILEHVGGWLLYPHFVEILDGYGFTNCIFHWVEEGDDGTRIPMVASHTD